MFCIEFSPDFTTILLLLVIHSLFIFSDHASWLYSWQAEDRPFQQFGSTFQVICQTSQSLLTLDWWRNAQWTVMSNFFEGNVGTSSVAGQHHQHQSLENTKHSQPLRPSINFVTHSLWAATNSWTHLIALCFGRTETEGVFGALRLIICGRPRWCSRRLLDVRCDAATACSTFRLQLFRRVRQEWICLAYKHFNSFVSFDKWPENLKNIKYRKFSLCDSKMHGPFMFLHVLENVLYWTFTSRSHADITNTNSNFS